VIKLIIFDLDGITLNTLRDLTNSTNFMLSSLGLPKKSEEFCASLLGWGVDVLIKGVLGNYKGDYDVARELFTNYYEIHQNDETKPYDNVLNFFSYLKKHGYLIAINSNKPHDRVVDLCNLYFNNYIDYISGDDFINPTKPDPTRTNLILQNLGVLKEEALYVGDSEVDYDSGVKAGIKTVIVSWGFRKKEFLLKLKADYLIDNMEEFYAILKEEKKELLVVAGVIKDNNKYYAARRGPYGETALKWEFPGGKVEINETEEEALRREIKEELSCEVRVEEHIITTRHEYNKFILVLSVYYLTLVNNTVPLISEHLEGRWFTKEELFKIEYPEADKIILEKLK
jgi:phosphoglycolate phosphatase